MTCAGKRIKPSTTDLLLHDGSHPADELVVNKVADKSITGYLSVPKSVAASAKASTN